MDIQSLRERLTELDAEYQEIQNKINNYSNEISNLQLRQQQLNGAYLELSNLIRKLSESEKSGKEDNNGI